MFVNGTPYFISVVTLLEYVMVDRITKKDESVESNSRADQPYQEIRL